MNSHQEILSVVELYFKSIFAGDVDSLRSTFHPKAILSGEVKGIPYYKPLDEYLEVVKNRKSPKDLSDVFKMIVISVEVTGAIGFVKANCPMLGFNYVDYLSFVFFDGKWVIASKVFTHLD